MRLTVLTFFILISGCSSHHEEKETINTVQAKEVAKDIKLPLNLFKEFEKEIAEEFKSVAPVYIFMPLQVQFSEVAGNRGVLKDTMVRFEFDKGGGQIDLKDVVSGTGSFYMSFPAEQFASTVELMHLFYISQSPIKKIQQESFGLGCGKWMDLKAQFSKLQKPNFLKLNTTKNRHLHVLSGQYVFFFKQTNQIYLSQLTVTDSRHSNELCTSVGDVE